MERATVNGCPAETIKGSRSEHSLPAAMNSSARCETHMIAVDEHNCGNDQQLETVEPFQKKGSFEENGCLLITAGRFILNSVERPTFRFI
uniref:Uncharacterized protein n=1 Tax=Trichuris muris TaxID=70415 RepID=A0A5S6QJP8_TRIMR